MPAEGIYVLIGRIATIWYLFLPGDFAGIVCGGNAAASAAIHIKTDFQRLWGAGWRARRAKGESIMKKLFVTLAAALFSLPVLAAGGGDVTLRTADWSFAGPFGTFDKASMQRGFQAYKEVCAGCHSMD